MIDYEANPPRAAEALLYAVLHRRDADAIAGDLLEEYRAVRRPALGTRRANVWFVRHVLSLAARPVWPFALALVAARTVLAALRLFPLSTWNPSLVPAPNVSVLDAVLFLAAGYYGAWRTGRIAAGIVNAGMLSLIDFALFATYATLLFPTLPGAIMEKPFILVIGGTLLVIAVAFALVLGAVGAVGGAWRARRVPRTRSA